MFDHWKINDKLVELGWKRHQVPYFKRGLVDSIEGKWNDNIINYTHDYDSWYCDQPPEPIIPYPDLKMKHGPVTYREEAYAAGHESGEDFIKQWVKTLEIDPPNTNTT